MPSIALPEMMLCWPAAAPPIVLPPAREEIDPVAAVRQGDRAGDVGADEVALTVPVVPLSVTRMPLTGCPR